MLQCLHKAVDAVYDVHLMIRRPLKYINQIRLRKAMNLLKTGAHTVTEVADAVGFQDYNHFGRLFRKAFGATPNRIRLEAAEKLAENSGNV